MMNIYNAYESWNDSNKYRWACECDTCNHHRKEAYLAGCNHILIYFSIQINEQIKSIDYGKDEYIECACGCGAKLSKGYLGRERIDDELYCVGHSPKKETKHS